MAVATAVRRRGTICRSIINPAQTISAWVVRCPAAEDRPEWMVPGSEPTIAPSASISSAGKAQPAISSAPTANDRQPLTAIAMRRPRVSGAFQ